MKTFLYLIFVGLQLSLSYGKIQAQNIEPDTLLYAQKPQINRLDTSFYFNSQGDDLFYRKWGELKNYETQKVLLIIHGIGYHSYPFKKIMNYTSNCDILLYAMDLRGHGFSGKTKGELESNEKVLTDIDNMVSIIKNENPNTPIYLFGTSMGGLYVLGYALSNSNHTDLSGLILAAPALKIHKSQIFQLKNLKLLWFLIFNHSKAGIHIDDKKLEISSINQEWIHSRKTDSLALHHVCAHYLIEIHQMQKMVKKKAELSLISIPVLIQHGRKDKIVDIKGSYYLGKNLKNAKAELTIYPNSYHSLFWDNDSNLIINDIIKWCMEN